MTTRVRPDQVHEVLGRHVLTDGMKLVLDLHRSSGCRLIDARDGRRYLDMYTFFASSPLGVNPPELVDDPEFMAEIAAVAVNKPANPDVYSTAYAEFVSTFARVLGDRDLPYLFFVEGGALAVENALKVAFDWKSQLNERAGRSPELGTRILHLTKAFHGRSGYTLSMTNTEPNKTDRFPVFDWPRIEVPAIRFPLADHLEEVVAAERKALDQARAAFDWKRRHNAASGRDPEKGTQVLHLTRAFHGRGGYTLSLTNTEPNKTARFPKFDWPRIDVPAITFPLSDHLDEVVAAEDRALDQARRAFAAFPHDIAAFIAEPIQGEGGDNHLRPEYLVAMLELTHAHDALFILDEVQTGVGTTGTPWAYQQLGITPDVVAFAKKVQVGGVMAGGRVAEVPDNVFTRSGRINSTWGGGLTDMVRSRKILEVVEEQGLIEQAGPKGAHFLARLGELAADHDLISNVRGRGLLVACDLPTTALRDEVLEELRESEGVLALGCGPRSLRFRPALTVREDDIDEAVLALGRVVARVRTSAEELVS